MCYNNFESKFRHLFWRKNIMPITFIFIGVLVVGLIVATLIKLLFNKISGKQAVDFSDLGQFFGIWIACCFIIFAVVLMATCETCLYSA